MYATRAAKPDERKQIQDATRYYGALGHRVQGLDATYRVCIETDSEVHAAQTPNVVYLRIKLPNHHYMYRVIEQR